MACENDKCAQYGMHHDYEKGVEVRKCQFCERDNQPERSKREDSERMKKLRESGLIGCLNGIGVNSENYKEVLRCGALNIVETQ